MGATGRDGEEGVKCRRFSLCVRARVCVLHALRREPREPREVCLRGCTGDWGGSVLVSECAVCVLLLLLLHHLLLPAR
jgi:hypothetical protein